MQVMLILLPRFMNRGLIEAEALEATCLQRCNFPDS